MRNHSEKYQEKEARGSPSCPPKRKGKWLKQQQLGEKEQTQYQCVIHVEDFLWAPCLFESLLPRCGLRLGQQTILAFWDFLF